MVRLPYDALQRLQLRSALQRFSSLKIGILGVDWRFSLAPPRGV